MAEREIDRKKKEQESAEAISGLKNIENQPTQAFLYGNKLFWHGVTVFWRLYHLTCDLVMDSV